MEAGNSHSFSVILGYYFQYAKVPFLEDLLLIIATSIRITGTDLGLEF